MKRCGAWLLSVGGGLLLTLACSDGFTRAPGNDPAAGAAGAVGEGEGAGQGGAVAAEGGAAGLSHGDAGEGGHGDSTSVSGAAGSDAGAAGTSFIAGGEAGAGASASTAGTSAGEGGVSSGGGAGTPGAAGAPPTRVTAEQQALCDSLCAREPLTNGFAGAPTAPCPNNEGCAKSICELVDLLPDPSEFCQEAFTDMLRCWDALPDDEFECSSIGVVFSNDGCTSEDATLLAACQ